MSNDPYYKSAAWRALRADCLRRDPVCKTPGCGRPSGHADHIVPRSRGGADALHNLRGLCPSCHSSVTRNGNTRPPKVRGCDANGMPLDPNHPWHKGKA